MSEIAKSRGKTPGDLAHYRLLTGPDDSTFCERVSEALSLGWQLNSRHRKTLDWDTPAQRLDMLLNVSEKPQCCDDS